MDRDTSTSNGFIGCTRRKASLSPEPIQPQSQRRYSHPVDRSTGLIWRSDYCAHRLLLAPDFDTPCVASDSKTPTPASGWCFSPTILSCRHSPSPSFMVAVASRVVFQMDQAAFRIKVFFGTSENAVKTKSGLPSRSTVLVAIVKSDSTLSASCMKANRSEPDHVRAIPLDQLLNTISPMTSSFSPNQLNLFIKHRTLMC